MTKSKTFKITNKLEDEFFKMLDNITKPLTSYEIKMLYYKSLVKAIEEYRKELELSKKKQS